MLEALGVEARRGVQYQGGSDSPDVIAAIRGVHLEVKRTEALRLYPAYEQARTEAPEGATPVVVHRRNGQPWLGILGFGDLVQLLKEAGRA